MEAEEGSLGPCGSPVPAAPLACGQGWCAGLWTPGQRADLPVESGFCRWWSAPGRPWPQGVTLASLPDTGFGHVTWRLL